MRYLKGVNLERRCPGVINIGGFKGRKWDEEKTSMIALHYIFE